MGGKYLGTYLLISVIDKGEHNVINVIVIYDYRNNVLWKVLGASFSFETKVSNKHVAT